MAEFLGSSDIFSKLNSMLEDAKSFIYLISPYIDQADTEQHLDIIEAAKRKVNITIVYRKDEGNSQKELSSLQSIKNIRILACPELHAKIYATENGAILTSKNLTNRTTGKSIEVGIFFGKDEEIYQKLVESANKIIKIAEGPKQERKSTPIRTAPKRTGYCIRCRERIPLNEEMPLCPKCFRTWVVYEDIEYPENFCHYCGKETFGISFRKPFDYECFQLYIPPR